MTQLPSHCIVTVVLAVFAGCGGSSDDSDATAESAAAKNAPTKAEFIKKADALCEKGNKEQSEDVRAYQEKPNASIGILLKNIVLRHIEANVKQLGELQAPVGDDEKVQAVVRANLEAVQQGKEDIASLANPESSPFVKGATLAQQYGFEVCGRYASTR